MTAPLLVAMLGGPVIVAVAGQARAAEQGQLRAQLQELSRHTILFGHQSVGANVIEGLRELAAGEGVPLRIAEIAGPGDVAPGPFAHTLVAENATHPSSSAASSAPWRHGPTWTSRW
jgi:hypothetical protein